jgi:hypothetical protein
VIAFNYTTANILPHGTLAAWLQLWRKVHRFSAKLQLHDRDFLDGKKVQAVGWVMN